MQRFYLVIITWMLSLWSQPTAGDHPPGQWDRIIQNRLFSEPLTLDSGDNNTLIIGAVFRNIDGHAITLRNVSNVYIKDCVIYDIDGAGIVLRSTGSTARVTIDGCKIYRTKRSGIMVNQRSEEDVDHSELLIKNNLAYDNGNDRFSHGIYVQSTDSIIESNTVLRSGGNGISIRSSGLVRGNLIINPDKSCIRYFSDHAPGSSDALTIENNVCYQAIDGSRQSPGISLLRSQDAARDWMVERYQIRFNTVIMLAGSRYGIAVESAGFDDKQVEIVGNLVVNSEALSKTISPNYVDSLRSNYLSTSWQHIVNSGQMPFDFHLTAKSPARGFASSELSYPRTDMDGQARNAGHLDAGADQGD